MNDYVVIDTDENFRELLNKVFTDEFMQKYTEFENFEGFKYSSAVMANWDSDQMIYSRAVFDNFVKESTQFTSWEEMVRTATDEKFGKRD